MYFEVFLFLVRKKKYNLKKNFNLWKNAIFDYYIFDSFIMKKFQRMLNDPFLGLFALNYVHLIPFSLIYSLCSLAFSSIFLETLIHSLRGVTKYQNINTFLTICAWLKIGEEFSILLLLDSKKRSNLTIIRFI
jgi:hypothetical protein